MGRSKASRKSEDLSLPMMMAMLQIMRIAAVVIKRADNEEARGSSDPTASFAKSKMSNEETSCNSTITLTAAAPRAFVQSGLWGCSCCWRKKV